MTDYKPNTQTKSIAFLYIYKQQLEKYNRIKKLTFITATKTIKCLGSKLTKYVRKVEKIMKCFQKT